MADINGILTSKAQHPGVILRAELKKRGLTQKQASSLLGLSTSHLSELLNGKRPLSMSVARLAQAHWGISDIELLNMQNAYTLCNDDNGDNKEAQAIAELEGFDKVIDIKAITKRLQKEYKQPFAELLAFIKSELSLTLPAAQVEGQYNGLFRRSAKTGQDSRMLFSWTLLARHSVKNIVPQGVYSKDKVGELGYKLRVVFHENSNVISRITELLSEYGIKFAICEKLDKASVDGFSFVQNNTPCIVVTNRIPHIDSLAFNVMHELGHIYAHINLDNEEDNRISVQDLSDEAEIDNRQTTEEQYADTFARQALIDKNIWRTAPSVPLNPFVIQSRFSKWAIDKGLNPWIVLGRISRETGMYKFKKDEKRNIN